MKFLSQYRGLRRELYILFIGRMMTNMGSMIWPIFTLILNQKLGLNATTIALYMLIFSIITIPVTLIGGKLADKLNKKMIIVFCDLVSIISFILCSFFEISMITIFIFAFASLFQSIEWPSYDALVADLTSTKDRERAYSLSYLGGNLGLVLSPTIAGFLFNNYLNLAFLINGISIGLSTILIFFFIKNIEREKEEGKQSVYEQDLKDGNTLSFLFKNRVILLFIIIVCFGELLYSMYNYLMPLELASHHGDKGSVYFGTLTSVNCITVVLSTAFITKKFAKIKEIGKKFIGEALIMFGLAMFALFVKVPAVFYVAMVIFTFGEVFNSISQSPFLTKRIPASHRGRLISIQGVCSGLFTSLMNIFAGYLYDNSGANNAWLFVFVIGIITLSLVLLLGYLDKKDYKDLYINEKIEVTDASIE